MTHAKAILLTISLVLTSALLFQNCSSGSLPANAENMNSSTSASLTATPQSCMLDGSPINSGSSLTQGYFQSTPSAGASSCPVAQAMTCLDGVWTPSVGASGVTSQTAFSTCSSTQPCTLGSQSYASGTTAPAFTASVAPVGGNCSTMSETLTCQDGVFYTSAGVVATNYWATCTPAAALAWEQTNLARGIYQTAGACPGSSTLLTYSELAANSVHPGACSTSGAKCQMYGYAGSLASGFYTATFTCQ